MTEIALEDKRNLGNDFRMRLTMTVKTSYELKSHLNRKELCDE